MSGSQPRIRRPILLVLVYGAFLAIVGITATAQATMVSAHFSAATLNDVVGSDAATIRAFVNAHLDARLIDQVLTKHRNGLQVLARADLSQAGSVLPFAT